MEAMETSPEMQQPQTQENFFKRAYSLPVVNATVDCTVNTYSKIKQYNSFTNGVLETTENGIASANEYVKPVLQTLEKPAGTVNNIACKALGKVEESLPIVTKSPQEISDKTKEMCKNTLQLAIEKYYMTQPTRERMYELFKDYYSKTTDSLLSTEYGRNWTAIVEEAKKNAERKMQENVKEKE